MRILFLLAALVLLGTFAPASLQRKDPPPPVTWVWFEPVPLSGEEAGAKRLGPLHYLGGWRLTSNDRRFGGVSAMHVEGGRLLAISDSGWIFRLPLPGAEGGRVRAAVERLVEGPGAPVAKSSRDVEALVVSGGEAWVAYEQANAVWRYDAGTWRARSDSEPGVMAKWRENRGAEAMVRLSNGRFLIFAEGSGGDSEALLFDGDASRPGTPAMRLRYRPPEGFRITDAAALPDGRILYLNRRVRLFEGFTARLSVGRLPERLAEGALLTGAEIAAFEPPVATDNYEALSLAREGGRTLLYVASDDNYNPVQRTLLLKFGL